MKATGDVKVMLSFLTGNRYILEQGGLKIVNISEDDNGRYVCRAEVQQDARYDFKDIDVVVHSTSVHSTCVDSTTSKQRILQL